MVIFLETISKNKEQGTLHQKRRRKLRKYRQTKQTFKTKTKEIVSKVIKKTIRIINEGELMLLETNLWGNADEVSYRV